MKTRQGKVRVPRFFALLCVVLATCSNEQPTKHNAVSPLVQSKDVTFGHRQINQMLADRPDMAGILDYDHPILLWIIDSMNGGRIGNRIYWSGDSPINSFAAHLPPYGYYPPHIRLSGGTESTGPDKWAGLVYELFNLENAKAVQELDTKAIKEKLDRETYAKQYTKLEYNALKKTEDFFKEHPLPNAVPGNNSRYDQMRQAPTTFEDYVQEFSWAEEQGRSRYDEVIVPYLESDQRVGE